MACSLSWLKIYSEIKHQGLSTTVSIYGNFHLYLPCLGMLLNVCKYVTPWFFFPLIPYPSCASSISFRNTVRVSVVLPGLPFALWLPEWKIIIHFAVMSPVVRSLTDKIPSNRSIELTNSHIQGLSCAYIHRFYQPHQVKKVHLFTSPCTWRTNQSLSCSLTFRNPVTWCAFHDPNN